MTQTTLYPESLVTLETYKQQQLEGQMETTGFIPQDRQSPRSMEAATWGSPQDSEGCVCCIYLDRWPLTQAGPSSECETVNSILPSKGQAGFRSPFHLTEACLQLTGVYKCGHTYRCVCPHIKGMCSHIQVCVQKMCPHPQLCKHAHTCPQALSCVLKCAHMLT